MAPPQQILDIVGNLSSTYVDAPRDLGQLFDFDALEVSAAKGFLPKNPQVIPANVARTRAAASSAILRPRASVEVTPAPKASTEQGVPAVGSGATGQGGGSASRQRLAALAPQPPPAVSQAYAWPTAIRRPETGPPRGESRPSTGTPSAALGTNGLGGQRAPANGLASQRVLLVQRSADSGEGAAEVEVYCSVVDAARQLLSNSIRWPPPVSDPRPAFFEHNDPKNQMLYGGWFGRLRAPTVLLEAPSEELLRYLREDPEGPFTKPMEEAEWRRWGFTRDKWQHSVLKADWHTLPTLGAEGEVFIPRLPGARVVKRAPPRILAFVNVFRLINQAVWLAIIGTLVGLKRAFLKEQSFRRIRLYDTIVACLQGQRHFGILEAQVRWGRGDMCGPSHKDGATSLLHLGLTLGGHRVLRIGAFPNSNSAGNRQFNPWSDDRLSDDMDAKERDRLLGESEVWDEDTWPSAYLKDVDMVPGSAYLSSPFCVEHGVKYRGCEEEQPVIAVQCRFGFSGVLGKELNDDRSEDMREVASVIAECLKAASASGQLRMPTLCEVQREVERLRNCP